jgi:hypothetical protein
MELASGGEGLGSQAGHQRQQQRHWTITCFPDSRGDRRRRLRAAKSQRPKRLRIRRSMTSRPRSTPWALPNPAVYEIKAALPRRWPDVQHCLIRNAVRQVPASVAGLTHPRPEPSSGDPEAMAPTSGLLSIPSNRRDLGSWCGDAPRALAGRLVGLPALSPVQGPQRSPGSRAGRRPVARSAMRSTLEAGGAAP